MLHLVGCLYYLYRWCTVKQISDNEICLLIKYIKSVLWRLAKCLSYIAEARCLKVNVNNIQWTVLWMDLLGMNFGMNGRNMLVMKCGPQCKCMKYVTIQIGVSLIIKHLFNCVCVDNLLVPTNACIILICILYTVYIFFLFLLPTCFSWPPSSVSLQTNGLKLTATN